MNLFKHFADCNKLILLMPNSTSHTWDGDHGAEVARLDRALEYVFSRYAIDPERLAIGGFSDGASYALTLGLVNDRSLYACHSFFAWWLFSSSPATPPQYLHFTWKPGCGAFRF